MYVGLPERRGKLCLVLSGGGTVTSSEQLVWELQSAQGEDLWQGVYLGAASVWEVSPLLHWPCGRDEPMEVTTNKVHYSNLGQTSQSPWASSLLTETTFACFLLIFFFFHSDNFFFCFLKIQDFFHGTKMTFKLQAAIHNCQRIYPLFLIIF